MDQNRTKPLSEEEIELFLAYDAITGESLKRVEFEMMREIVKQLYEEKRGLKKQMDRLEKLVKRFMQETPEPDKEEQKDGEG